MRMRKLSLSLALAAPLAVVAIPNGANTAAADPPHAATRSTAPMPPTAVRPSAVAAPLTLRSTIDPNSNIRFGPHLNSRILLRTRALTPAEIYCYSVGDFYSDGRHSTRIWYDVGIVIVVGYVWGGNVNTRHDPPPGLQRC